MREQTGAFCPQCGAPTGLDAVFCGKCGKQLPAKGRNSWALPITLLLFFAVSNITGALVSWAFAGLGLAVVFVLWITKCIKPERIELSTLCIPIAVLLLEGMRNLGFRVVFIFAEQFMGQYGAISSFYASSVFPSIENTYGANALWLWGLLIWFLLLRSNTVRQKGIHYLIVGIGLVIWSLVLTHMVPGHMLAMEQGMPPEILHYFNTAYEQYFTWMFLRRFLVYCLFCYAGTRRLGPVGTLIFPAVVIVGSMILMVFCFYQLSLGMVSIGALSFGYLFGVIILLAALIREKKKQNRTSS